MAQEAGSMSGEGGSNSSVGSTSGGNGTYTPPKGPSTTTPATGGKVGGGDPNYGKYKGKDGKYYNTVAEKTAADDAFDAAEAAKAAAAAQAADLAARTDPEGNVYASVAEMVAALTGKDGVKYGTVSERQKADAVYDSQAKLGGIKMDAVDPLKEATLREATLREATKKSDTDILLSAQGVAGSAQSGAVSSATEAAKASGLSPAQAALLGSSAGASTYAKEIGGALNTQGQLAQEQYATEKQANEAAYATEKQANLGAYETEKSTNLGKYTADQQAAAKKYDTQMQTAMSEYATNVSALTGKTGQALQKYISDQGNAIALKLQQMNLDAEKVKNTMNAMGFIFQAGSWILKAFGIPAAAKGTDSAVPGPYLVGEKGPEIVIPGEGARIIPADKTKQIRDIHDGYGMLEDVINSVAPRLVKFPDFEASPEQPNVKLSDLKPKIESSMAYLKGAK